MESSRRGLSRWHTVNYRMVGRCRRFILWRSIFWVIRRQPLEWWANKTWPLRLTSFRRCSSWLHTLVGFACYGAPGLLGLEALQLTCCGLCGPGRSAVLLYSWGGGFLTRRLPLLLPARDQPLCIEDAAFSIGMLCRPSRSTMNFTWLIERVARAE